MSHNTRLGRVKTVALRDLIAKDARIIDVSIEDEDGVFIYTASAQWDDGNGSGTFRGDTETAAVARFKALVQRNEEGRM
jgi:hypothetical protein